MTTTDSIAPTDTPGTMTDVADLAALVPVEAGGTASTTAFRANGARVVVFAFDAGQDLHEHTAAVPVLIQVLDGKVRITADGRDVSLTPGGIAHMDAKVPHSVHAEAPSRMALILLDSRPKR